jgi:hypothetical protein
MILTLASFGLLCGATARQFFGHQERQFQRLAGVQAWVASRVVAI